ncbi:MAG: response regulator [Candidatus Liptonbacteria bacterium]|nr:response regulator [Candidatus Liptonbacteria bacterium]
MHEILIVEDEEFLLRALQDNLKEEGYGVQVARNGEEAIAVVSTKKPSLILLDLLLPKRDGFWVLGELKKNPEWALIPVVVLSNLGGDNDIKRALQLGARDYFVKSQHPIGEVVEKVKYVLEETPRA